MKHTAVVVGSLLLGLTGCAAEVGSAESDGGGTESVAEVKSAFTPVSCTPPKGYTYDVCWEQQDSTGSINVRIYGCSFTAAARDNGTICQVEADRVLVGGGAGIDSSNGNGAFLRASMPGGDGRSWLAVSSDQVFPDAHRLRAFAVGLKLNGYTRSQLAAAVTQTQSFLPTEATHDSSAIAPKPSGHILLGGGGIAEYGSNYAQHLLTGLIPGSVGWQATSSDHKVSALKRVTAYTLSMPECPPGLGYCLGWGLGLRREPNQSGYFNTTHFETDPRAVVVSPGAETTYHGYGRLLSGVFPYPTASGGVFMSSKDSGVADTGTDYASYVKIFRL